MSVSSLCSQTTQRLQISDQQNKCLPLFALSVQSSIHSISLQIRLRKLEFVCLRPRLAPSKNSRKVFMSVPSAALEYDHSPRATTSSHLKSSKDNRKVTCPRTCSLLQSEQRREGCLCALCATKLCQGLQNCRFMDPCLLLFVLPSL